MCRRWIKHSPDLRGTLGGKIVKKQGSSTTKNTMNSLRVHTNAYPHDDKITYCTLSPYVQNSLEIKSPLQSSSRHSTWLTGHCHPSARQIYKVSHIRLQSQQQLPSFGSAAGASAEMGTDTLRQGTDPMAREYLSPNPCTHRLQIQIRHQAPTSGQL